MNAQAWMRIVGAVSASVLVALMLWGDYQYYFNKPVPVVNNNTFQPGSTVQVDQGKAREGLGMQVGLLGGPLVLGGKMGAFGGVSVGWRF